MRAVITVKIHILIWPGAVIIVTIGRLYELIVNEGGYNCDDRAVGWL